ncbi:CMP-N-acetylneuraminic acid synthetase [Bacillus sp. OV322]|uniref:cytidylyltransferase domain-containing protein n=1 Tax=Bacillus sp. OV322 TaxID=1882764 RepID=UPI0008E8FF25|nr:N-acylneuraminate cytidylyltransferase [Bacillus sp. OV322]SFC52462.1 CMP-N-acetylneuraminic acid synthetase [Bacillus sp. OV322]
MNILAVIPARGGSKGIPRKNVRLMNGKPLISYSIENAKSCEWITDVVITTDDEEIIGIAKLNTVAYVERLKELAEDNVTLDPVIYDAVLKMEKEKNIGYDFIVTLQPTSPLLKSSTLNNAIESFINSGMDTYISAVNIPHLSWSANESGYFPNYEERVNRQQLPPNYIETGAFFITKREYVKPNSRMGQDVSIFEVPEEESVDIDTKSDWLICENALKRKRIIFRVDGYKELGMGHIYHCLTLAYNLTGHEIMFVTKEKCTEGVNKIKSSYMPYTLINSDEEFFDFLVEWDADIVVNDCLDTDENYIQKLKKIVSKVITIEDLGEGAEYADAVINALYNKEKKLSNEYYGESYVCLRDEFLINKPKTFSKEVKNILVIFGGTDPSNLTKKIYHFATKINKNNPRFEFNFITGKGYNSEDNGIYTLEDKKIFVLNDVKRVSDYMINADIAFTSQGRTVFELASLGIPSIVLSQNEREQLHTFAQMQNGFMNLGLGKNISIGTIESTFKWLVEAHQIRHEMRELMLRHDLKKGIKRVIDIILKED